MTRLLVVDDDVDFLDTIAKALRLSGYEVLTAPGGKPALEALRTHQLDVLVTDVLMPDVDGLTVIQEARKRWPGIKVIVFSGGGRGSSEPYLKAAQQFGADAALSKPFRMQQLVEILQHLPSSRGTVS